MTGKIKVFFWKICQRFVFVFWAKMLDVKRFGNFLTTKMLDVKRFGNFLTSNMPKICWVKLLSVLIFFQRLTMSFKYFQLLILTIILFEVFAKIYQHVVHYCKKIFYLQLCINVIWWITWYLIVFIKGKFCAFNLAVVTILVHPKGLEALLPA